MGRQNKQGLLHYADNIPGYHHKLPPIFANRPCSAPSHVQFDKVGKKPISITIYIPICLVSQVIGFQFLCNLDWFLQIQSHNYVNDIPE